MDAADRLRAFLDEKGWSTTEAGKAFECDGSFVSLLLRRRRLAGRRVSNAIARVTADWASGAIRSEEWEAVIVDRDQHADDEPVTPKTGTED
jgi:hypothetical protein